MISSVAGREHRDPAFWVLGDHYQFKITGEQSGGSLCVVEHTAFPHHGPPPHIHHREDESFYILEGELSILLGDQMLTAGAGSFVHVPKGMLHTYQNTGARPAKTLVILTPAGFEKFWQDLGEPATSAESPPPLDPAAFAKVLALAPKYHLEVRTSGMK
jgi:mannose-6-phosphate isomerase-like protein (cupin superfamily)